VRQLAAAQFFLAHGPITARLWHDVTDRAVLVVVDDQGRCRRLPVGAEMLHQQLFQCISQSAEVHPVVVQVPIAGVGTMRAVASCSALWPSCRASRTPLCRRSSDQEPLDFASSYSQNRADLIALHHQTVIPEQCYDDDLFANFGGVKVGANACQTTWILPPLRMFALRMFAASGWAHGIDWPTCPTIALSRSAAIRSAHKV